jgi:hypothetical protein
VLWLTILVALQQSLWIDVPFIRQEKNACGAASIWMVMKYWQPEAPADVAQIQQQLYSEEAGGIYATDMSKYFESRGYRAIAFHAEWTDLEEQVAKGRPLIVSLERNRRGVPLHYVVVAGIDSVSNLVLLNDPAQRKLLSMSRTEFEQSWRATDNWALLALPELSLASQAFRDDNLAEAREHLSSALRTNPADAYANDFLATVYLLENNTEAALKYWNRSAKPLVENIRIDPPLQTDPVLLDRAFAFSRGSVLRLDDFEKTQARLSALGIFSRYRMELSPNATDSFDVTLRAAERTGASRWSWARGLPFQSIKPEFLNIGGKALNVSSMLRWDSNKQRASVAVETPLNGNPAHGVRASADFRKENWVSPDGGFAMKKILAAAEIYGVQSGRWNWTSAVSFSHRLFSNDFSGGVQLKYSAAARHTWLRDPARHVNLDSSIAIDAGRLWAESPARFGKIVTSTKFGWQGLTSEVRLGTAIGQLPFDERFVIGLERDSDLWLRAHSASVNGRKNGSNTARAFILTNSDFQRKWLDTGWFHMTAGPFLDTGKSSMAPRWIVDMGFELRFTVLQSVGITVSFGKSLSDARRSFFARQTSM